MKLTISIGNKQQQHISLRLQQAIKLLELSTSELEQTIQSTLESNPLLEEWAEPHVYKSNVDWSEYENYSSAPNLQQYLAWQLHLGHFSATDKLVGLSIIDAIDDDGYLTIDLQEIQNNHPDRTLEEIGAVLKKIQSFDPVGVASRDLQECLLLQIESLSLERELGNHCRVLINKHLKLLARKDYKKLKSALRIEEAELEQIIQIITSLKPRPGSSYSNTKVEYIQPDLVASRNENGWHAILHKDLSANIRVNPSYAALIRRADNSRDNTFLREQLIEARLFLNGIKNRNLNLLKVANYIVKYQAQFLEHGEEKLLPLNLKQVADQIGLSEATISRISRKKYIATPHGIYEVKRLFSSHTTNNQGQDCASFAIKAIIKKLISKESGTNTLSDQAIVDIMLQNGIKIARRTVAKYRESLGIDCSNKRKS